MAAVHWRCQFACSLPKNKLRGEAARILDTKGPELSEDFDPGPAIVTQEKEGDTNQQILSEVRRLHHTNQWILLVTVAVFVMAIYLVVEIPRHTSPWSPVYWAVRRYDYERALTLAKTIVRDHPEDYYGHEYLGYIYLQMGNLNQAELEYSRACELAPPKGLQEKLDEIRKRRERESRPRPTATPLPWP